MKKLNKKRLAKLTFWVVHVISIGAIIIGLISLSNYKRIETGLLQKHEECVSRIPDNALNYADRALVCTSYMNQIDSYNSIMTRNFFFGLILLIAYWVIRGLYKFLFTEEKTDSSEFDSIFKVETDDILYEKAKELVLKSGKTQASHLQEKLRIGYARAYALIERMEKEEIVGPADGVNPRKILKNS